MEENSRNKDLERFAKEQGFSYTPVYFELFTDLEQALQSGQIDAAFTSSLRKTEEELIRQYRDGEKMLVVSVCTDKKPYAYLEHGEAKGILVDYFAKLADYVGVPYTVIAPEDRETYAKWCEEENAANVF